MTGLVDWASSHARMIIAMVVLSIAAGVMSYVGLPKEGEPDIDVPILFVSVPFPGISAEDSEKLIVKPLETKLRDLDGLKTINANASEGYGGVLLEFEFGWDKGKTIADVRDKVSQAEAEFPNGAEQYSINEINFSEFPILVVSLSGAVPERTLLRVAKELQDEVEGLEAVLEAGLAGHRDEMVEVVIDPLKLESYNVTAGELINVVVNNNRLIAAGEIKGESGSFSVKIPSAFDDVLDVYALPVKTNGDRVITLGDLADIRLTFEDRSGTARYNQDPTVALQVVKRKGFNVIQTSQIVRETVTAAVEEWPQELRDAIRVDFSMDTSVEVDSMVSQLEASVLTAIALVMIVVLGSLGIRSALLVGFAIPTSFLLCFALLSVFGMAISNIVMFGLILAVGMLVDGAIVVVEYADKEIQRGIGPMTAYRHAAKRMFWPIVSSTATTLCAFLPMLFWPGIPGEFMGNLPVTLIFVLSASLVVALIFLPVIGGVAGRMSRTIHHISDGLRRRVPWILRAILAIGPAIGVFYAFLYMFLPGGPMAPGPDGELVQRGSYLMLGLLGLIAAWLALSVLGASLMPQRREAVGKAGYKRSRFGRIIHFIAGNPIMPFVSVGLVIGFVMSVFSYFGENNYGVEFFVETEPERAIAYVRARGNLSLAEKDAYVRQVEEIIVNVPGVESVFAFAGSGGLNQNSGGAEAPKDAVGQVQIELDGWQERYALGEKGRGGYILNEINRQLANVPGIQAEISEQAMGPASGKPLHLRLKSSNWEDLQAATALIQKRFEADPLLKEVENTLPLPGIDWQIDVDVETAGRFGADVATVGAMVQLVTRGLTVDTMRVDSSDEEIDIRVRLPEEDRILATLDTLRVRTREGLVPLSNFISRQPVRKLGQIERTDGQRYFDVKANIVDDMVKLTEVIEENTNSAEEDAPAVEPKVEFLPAKDLETDEVWQARLADGSWKQAVVNPNERIAALTEWLEETTPLPSTVSWEWTGDQKDQEESGAFLMTAFTGALGLMFIILLAQFNSVYNSILVLTAVVLSVTGCLIGMLVMEQPFSIIMTGTGIVALAGIVVNNNIVLIDTYQEFSRYMPRIEAITRTAEARIRPVLLTTITTMAGLAPMMFGLSVDFVNGGFTIDAPTSLWWKQLATAVVFGLGLATVLTLVVTPALLAVRVWATKGAYGFGIRLLAIGSGRNGKAARDLRLARAAKRRPAQDVQWEHEIPPLRLRHPIFAGKPKAAE
ncbi:efflux RND transporter permease subunit [Halovulum sp. GXIMD14793]